MKQYLILFLALFTTEQLCSQDLCRLVIEPVECDNIIYRECHPRNGVIVFYSTASDLEFDLPQMPDRLMNEPFFDAHGSKYVVCVKPTDRFAGGITQYAVDVMAKGCKKEILFVNKINPGQVQCFKVTKIGTPKGPKGKDVVEGGTSDNLHRWNTSLGGGVNILGNATFFMSKFDIGFFTGPNSLLSLEVGIGTGSYTEYEFTNVGFYNGNINYVYEKTFLFLGSWSYVTGNKSNSFQWRIGPSVGMLSVSGYVDYCHDIMPLESKQAFVIGANTGITWNIGKKKRLFFDLGYHPYYHTNINFGESSDFVDGSMIIFQEKDLFPIGNQVNLSFGFRFGKTIKN